MNDDSSQPQHPEVFSSSEDDIAYQDPLIEAELRDSAAAIMRGSKQIEDGHSVSLEEFDKYMRATYSISSSDAAVSQLTEELQIGVDQLKQGKGITIANAKDFMEHANNKKS